MVMVSMCLPKTYGGLAELANHHIKHNEDNIQKRGRIFIMIFFLFYNHIPAELNRVSIQDRRIIVISMILQILTVYEHFYAPTTFVP